MKKAILFLSTLLLLCSFAWSQGVTVSGAVTGKVGSNDYSYFAPTDSVVLTNTTTQVERKTGIVADEQTRACSYSFTGVEAGSYKLSVFTSLMGVPASYEKTITVESSPMTEDILVEHNPEYVFLSVKGIFRENEWNQYDLDSVLVTCTLNGSTTTAYALRYGSAALFYCDTNSEYTISLHKEGYKDTTFKTKALSSFSDGVSRGKELRVPMQEDLGNQVTLKGALLIGESTTDTLKIANLQLVAAWKDKTYTTSVQSGKYEFTERIPVGEITYTLRKYENYQTDESKNWKFSNGKDTVKYTISGADGAEVAQDLKVKRVGVTVRGLVKDTIGVEDVAFAHSVSAKIKIGNDSVTNSDFILEGISDGTHTAYITAHAHKPLEKQFTVDMTNMKVDSVIDFGVIYMEGQADTFSFSGYISYYDNNTSTTYYVKQSKVIMFTSDGKKVDSTTTDNYGSFSMRVECMPQTEYTFTVYSEDIKGGSASSTVMTREESVMVSFSGFEFIVPEPEPTDHFFYGQLYYYGADYSYVYLDSAKVMMFDAVADTLVDSTYTDKSGNFEIKVSCLPTAEYHFTVSHPDIDDAATTSPVRASSERNNVSVYCQAYLPCMENVKAEQVGDRRVKLSWNWVEALVDGYTMPDKDSIYEISRIMVYRRATNQSGASNIGNIIAENGKLPVTEYIDSTDLVVDQSYTYYFGVSYNKPSRYKEVNDLNALTVTVKAMCTLTLSVNDEEMGSVTGAGKFMAGTEVTVNATAKEGYRFVNWKSSETVVATTAEHKFILSSDSTLTANFEANAVVPDSVVLTLKVNNAAYGTVTGAGKYEKGEEVTIKATANNGYVFVAWMNGTDTASKSAEYKFEIEEDLTLTAVFAQKVGNDRQELASWNAYVENGQIVLTSSIPCQYAVYNVSGMLIKQGRMNTGRCLIDAPKSGLYLIRRVGTGVSVRKVMVR